MRVEPEQTGELSGLDQQRDGKAERGRRTQPHPERAGADETERHEEDDVHDDLEHGGDAVLANIRYECQRVELGRDAVGDPDPGIACRQRIEGEAAQTEKVQDDEVGPHRGPEAQAAVAVVEVREDGKREHERSSRPKPKRHDELVREAQEKPHVRPRSSLRVRALAPSTAAGPCRAVRSSSQTSGDAAIDMPYRALTES